VTWQGGMYTEKRKREDRDKKKERETKRDKKLITLKYQ